MSDNTVNVFDLDNGPSAPAPKAERKVAKFWLNVAMKLNIDGEDVLITLPLGIPLDDMQMVQPKGSRESSEKFAQAKNQLLRRLQEKLGGFEPGQREVIPQLIVEAYRRAEPKAIGSASTNDIVAEIDKAFDF